MDQIPYSEGLRHCFTTDPSRVDESTNKGARFNHLLGLEVEFVSKEGIEAWVGSPHQDHARVSFAVCIQDW